MTSSLVLFCPQQPHVSLSRSRAEELGRARAGRVGWTHHTPGHTPAWLGTAAHAGNEDLFWLFFQSYVIRLVCYESERVAVAGTISPRTGNCRQLMICTLNCWDHHWFWTCTSYRILAENLIIHNTEDGRKHSALCFIFPVQVLEKIVLPVFAEGEISFPPSLQLSLFPTLLCLNKLFAHGSFQLPGNTVQLCFRTTSWWLQDSCSKGWFMKTETHLPNDVLRAF